MTTHIYANLTKPFYKQYVYLLHDRKTLQKKIRLEKDPRKNKNIFSNKSLGDCYRVCTTYFLGYEKIHKFKFKI